MSVQAESFGGSFAEEDIDIEDSYPGAPNGGSVPAAAIPGAEGSSPGFLQRERSGPSIKPESSSRSTASRMSMHREPSQPAVISGPSANEVGIPSNAPSRGPSREPSERAPLEAQPSGKVPSERSASVVGPARGEDRSEAVEPPPDEELPAAPWPQQPHNGGSGQQEEEGETLEEQQQEEEGETLEEQQQQEEEGETLEERMASNDKATSSKAQHSAASKLRTQKIREQSTLRWLQSRTPHERRPDSAKTRTAAPKPPSAAMQTHRLHTGHNYTVNAVALSNDGFWVATASRDVRLYEARTGRIRAVLDGHAGLVRCLAFTPDSRILCTGSDDSAILVWSMETCIALAAARPGSLLTLTPPGFPSSTNPMGTQMNPGSSGSGLGGGSTSATPRSQQGGATGFAATISGASSANSSPMARVVQKVLKRHHKPVLSMCTTPDSKYLVSGSADKTLRVWDVGSGYCLATLRGHHGDVAAVAVTPNGKTILSGGTDRMILVWNFATGECTRTLKGHKGSVTSIAIAPDGQWLVTGGFDRALRVWDLSNGNELAVLPAHGGAYGVLCCAISPDGGTIMSGGYDRLVKLWDANSGLPLVTLDAHHHVVGSVAFSRDSCQLATAARDDDVRLWSWDPSLLYSNPYGTYDSGAGATGNGTGQATNRRPQTASTRRF